ncbi:hypothetical protein N7528_003491 [Penicillium herquei]|nr:hypothetical protein N7528_003491 [Penicillium herquei]
MKAATFFTLLTAAATAMAAPAKRQSYTDYIFSDIKATLTSTSGSLAFDLYDTNYKDNTTYSLSWVRPGEPTMQSYTADGQYTITFPNNVTSVEQFEFIVDRDIELMFGHVILNSEAEDSEWTCGTLDGVAGTQSCHSSADLSVTPIMTQ